MAEIKFLTQQGLTYYHGKLKDVLATKVDKVEGYGLSKNDYTDQEKQKLAILTENVIEKVKVDGVELTVADDKSVNIDLTSYAKKSDLTSVYKYKGSVASISDLPTSNNVVGDVYDVKTDGQNYAWDGTQWDALGGTVDLTPINNAIALKLDKSDLVAITTSEIDALFE